jgi:hypothetical protein
MSIIAGTVFSEGTRSKLTNAVIKATAADGKVLSAISDDQGFFTFDNLDSGEWTLVAMKEGYFTSKFQKIDLVTDRKDVRFNLALMMDEVDEKAGRTLFYILLGTLGGLIIAYIVLHLVFPQANTGAESSFLWGDEPYRFIEVLFWGLAGILVDKLMSIGYYLRRGTFYRRGILMHISHIICVPLLTLVVVFLISLVTLSLTLTGNNEVQLDLSDPRLLVAISFILGSRPWGLRTFIQRTAEKITEDKEKE